ncbi:MAG: hypothetical protein LBQ71_11580 [Hungatella sp.]|jgi:hypothetical protein|nr:hypothetical protein [Hungatella sp.]
MSFVAYIIKQHFARLDIHIEAKHKGTFHHNQRQYTIKDSDDTSLGRYLLDYVAFKAEFTKKSKLGYFFVYFYIFLCLFGGLKQKKPLITAVGCRSPPSDLFSHSSKTDRRKGT